MEKTSDIDQLTDALRDCETKNAKLQDDAVMNNKEKAKSRMRLRMTQAKLDMHRCKYSEAVDEMEFMHRNYKDGTAKLKEKLSSIASENLNLKKLLAAANK